MGSIQVELDRMVEAGLPGTFVYVEETDGSSQFYTAGVADLTTQRPMTAESHYRVGSTTKTFTATVTLQLVAEGRLALDDTLQERLPDLPIPNAETLTLEHLLRMRSGLFDFVKHPSLLSLEANLQPHSLQDVVKLGLDHPPSFPPGAKYDYCNTNFCLLELVIERITGHSLAEEFGHRIFFPLGLESTIYPDEDDLTLPEPYIRGYDWTADGWRECSRSFFGRGDGALISTALDLARFFRALLVEGSLLPDHLLKQMMYIVPDNTPAEKEYGLGLIADRLPCGTVWGHSGRGFGYHHFAFLRVETGRFAVFMLNGTYGFQVPTAISSGKPQGFSDELRCLVYS
jgi:D-alanyl-D-alanine carboxypeptidase